MSEVMKRNQPKQQYSMMKNLFQNGSPGCLRESHSQPRVIESLNDDLPGEEGYQHDEIKEQHDMMNEKTLMNTSSVPVINHEG